MSAESLKSKKGGWKWALGVTGVGNDETSLYLCCAVLTKSLTDRNWRR